MIGGVSTSMTLVLTLSNSSALKMLLLSTFNTSSSVISSYLDWSESTNNNKSCSLIAFSSLYTTVTSPTTGIKPRPSSQAAANNGGTSPESYKPFRPVGMIPTGKYYCRMIIESMAQLTVGWFPWYQQCPNNLLSASCGWTLMEG